MAQMPQPPERIEKMKILDELKNSYLNYAMSVIVSRALPDIRDGLKPSQRRILVAMNDLNLGPRSAHRKCAKIVGDTGGNYHPHGDQATYGTLVRLGQEWNLRYPLVDPQGNFGSIDADPPAAMRYTEARMASPAVDMLEDIKYDTVDFVPNYDETRTEPVVLPSKFPNLLVNGTTGIAVGMATNIPPHNISEVCDALLLVINDPDCGFKEIIEKLPGPDFPTGGIICGKKGIIDAYTTGRGHLRVRAKTHIEETKRGRQRIVITEIPYTVIKTTIVSKIAENVQNGTIPEVADIRDESDRKGLRIVIDLKKDAEEQVVLNKLYRYSSLQTTFAVANISLVNNKPETLNIRQMLNLFVEHRKTVIRRRTRFLLKRSRNRAHILEGLLLAIGDIDEIIDIIKKSPDTPTAKINLMKKPLRLTESATLREVLPEAFVKRCTSEDQHLTGPQADAILTMQLQRLTGLEMQKLAQEFADLTEQIEGYEAILASEPALLDIIREDIHEIKEKYGDERRTLISSQAQTFEDEDLIAEEDVIVTVSHAGYIKRMSIDTYRRQGRGGRGVMGSDIKEGDFIELLFCASTHDYLLVFTTGGKCHWLKVHNLPNMSRTARGRNIANLLNFAGSEKIASIINVPDFDQDKPEEQQRKLVMATRNGLVKKTTLAAYSNPRASGVIAIKLDDDDELIGVALTSGKDDMLLGTKDGMVIRFEEAQVRSMGRATRGVKGIKLRKGDYVVGMTVPEPGQSLLTVCEKGYGKRTDLDLYRRQSRAGMGLIDIKTTDRNGPVVTIATVHDEGDIIFITHKGIVIRTGIDQISRIGRNTQGVRLIRLDDGDKVVAAAKIVKEDDADEQEPGSGEQTDSFANAQNQQENDGEQSQE